MEYTEEEKKAIEEAKNQIVECDNLDNLNCFLTDSTTLKILLNLIEKLQKEIEKKEQRLIITREAYDRVVLEVVDLEENSIPKEVIREKLDEQYKLWNTPNRQKEYSQELVDAYEELLGE